MPSWGQDPARGVQPAKARVDLYGDPLPEGAIARLGSVRFRHHGAVRAVAFSPDGKFLAASSDGRDMVVIWDRATGRKLHEMPSIGPPCYLRFSPEGEWLYSSFGTGLHVRNVATGLDANDLPHPPLRARLLGQSPNAREICVLDKTEIVRWDVEKDKELSRHPMPAGDVSIAAWVGEQLLVPVFDGQSVGMWDMIEKKKLWFAAADRDKHNGAVPMTFSTDGKLFAVEGPPQVLSVYDSVTGKLIRRLEAKVEKTYWSVHISPDKRTVAGSNWDGTLRLWDLESGRERVNIPAIEGWITNVFFAPDSKTFATGDPNNAHAVLLWDTATGKRIDPFVGHASPIASMAYSPDGKTVATSSSIRGDAVVLLWDPLTSRILASLQHPDGHGVTAVVFSPDGETLATCGWLGDQTVRLWDVRDGCVRHSMTGHEARCTCVAFSPDGTRLVSGDAYCNHKGEYEGRLCVWDTRTGERLHEIQGTPGAVQQVLFSRDGRQIVVVANGVHVYDASTGQLVGEPFQARSRIWSLALSADGRLLATSGEAGQFRVRLWEMATRREIPITIPDAISGSADITPDGRTLVLSCAKKGVILFNWPSGEIVGGLAGGFDYGHGGVFSMDGRNLVTVADSGSSALTWDVADLVNRRLPAVNKPTVADLRQWWADLRADHPGVAYTAVWRFAAAPEQSLPFLADSLQPVPRTEPAAIARLIAELDSDEFAVREKASIELERLGDLVVDALKKARMGEISVEQRRLVNLLLAKLDSPAPTPEQLRTSRALAALEQIGGAEAQKILARLSDGAAGARMTQEAKAALERSMRLMR
jgi:WD40 repeat protein